jgi:hypothetical protein
VTPIVYMTPDGWIGIWRDRGCPIGIGAGSDDLPPEPCHTTGLAGPHPAVPKDYPSVPKAFAFAPVG